MPKKLLFSIFAILLIMTTGSAFAEATETGLAETVLAETVLAEKGLAETGLATANEAMASESETTESLQASTAFDLFLAVQSDLNYSPANPLAAVPSCGLECRRDSDCHPSGACRCIFIFPSCGFCNC